MASGYCQGCQCGAGKDISGPSFSACRTRLTGGISGILIACESDFNDIPTTWLVPTGTGGATIDMGVDLDPDSTAGDTDVELLDLLDLLVNNGNPIVEPDPAITDPDNGVPTPHYHYWCVDADMPDPEDELEEENNCYGKSVIQRTHKLVGDILDVNDSNYEMLREYQCVGDMRLWFITKSGQFYGGNKGIPVSVTKFNYLIPRGVKELQKISFEFEWSCLKQPPRFSVINWSIPHIGFTNASVS